MTARILTLFILLNLTKVFPCSCSPPTIAASFEAADVIFVGQYNGQSKIGGVYGLPVEIENFEVFRFLKGKDISLIKKVLKNHYHSDKPIVSLSSSAHSSCGYNFTKNKYYIVYAYKNFGFGLITTDGCIATHEIEANQLNEYLSETSTNSEVIKLISLAKADTLNVYITEPNSVEDYVPKSLLINSEERLQNEINNRNIILCITLPTILALLVLMAFRKKKQH